MLTFHFKFTELTSSHSKNVNTKQCSFGIEQEKYEQSGCECFYKHELHITYEYEVRYWQSVTMLLLPVGSLKVKECSSSTSCKHYIRSSSTFQSSAMEVQRGVDWQRHVKFAETKKSPKSHCALWNQTLYRIWWGYKKRSLYVKELWGKNIFRR